MSKLFRLCLFACVVCALDPLSIASAPPTTKTTREKSAKTQTTVKKQTTSKQSQPEPIDKETLNAVRGGKKGRPTGQELAKEFKENIQKTGSLTGRHHPMIDSAIKSAKAHKKSLLLVFITKTCPHCAKLQKETLENKQFKDRFLKDYELYLIDCDKSPEVAEHYLYDSKVPHSKVINTKGQIVRQVTGYSDDEKYADFLTMK